MLTIVLLDVILLVVLLIMSVPLPYCFGGALLFMSIFGGVSMKSMMLWGFNQMINPVLLASPLFILAGSLMGGSGIAKRLLDFVDAFVGRIKGGLGVISVVTCALIGAISEAVSPAWRLRLQSWFLGWLSRVIPEDIQLP